MMITAAQCRSARILLGWSGSRLASAASVSQCEIDDFELERCTPKAATLETIQRALETAGMAFLPHDDYRSPLKGGQGHYDRSPERVRRGVDFIS